VLPLAIVLTLSAWGFLAWSLRLKLADDAARTSLGPGTSTVSPAAAAGLADSGGGAAGAQPVTPSAASLNLLPSSFEELRASSDALQAAVAAHGLHFLLLFCAAYVIKQALCVPGSVALNAFAGMAFGTARGVPLTIAMTVAGVCCCYGLSWLFLARAGRRWNLEERILPLRMQVEAARKAGTLGFYLVSLRLLPLVPQWLINLAAPHAGVPLLHFAAATGLGLAPYNAVTVHAGAVVSTLTGWGDVLTPRVLVALVGLAAMALAPPLVLRYKQRRRGRSHAHKSSLPSAGGGDSNGGAGSGAAAVAAGSRRRGSLGVAGQGGHDGSGSDGTLATAGRRVVLV
jgi:uncharacterized membrane protein YdjX (TVP38/TMEM64 family)